MKKKEMEKKNKVSKRPSSTRHPAYTDSELAAIVEYARRI